ncbi:jg16742 [Pararge aegeria aegeria]|uniref:Jg16742 protein n=1 Tax=Pararge aegeria aegeria TaxID=348720 RepID=A0A8S4S1A0_9NEOP|nr:jg16742 [Pararge aegeria aegeria]
MAAKKVEIRERNPGRPRSLLRRAPGGVIGGEFTNFLFKGVRCLYKPIFYCKIADTRDFVRDLRLRNSKLGLLHTTPRARGCVPSVAPTRGDVRAPFARTCAAFAPGDERVTRSSTAYLTAIV